MTLPLNSRLSALYETNGTQKDFSFGFRVFFDPDNGGYGLEVRRQTADGYEIIPKSDYLVLPVEDNSAGIVRFSVAPSAGQQIYIAGKTPTIQQLVLTNFGRYSAESIETQFDFITAIIQEWLSALGEETRQRIAADDILTQYVVNRIDAFVQQINQNWDDKSQEIEDYIATIMPSFTQTLRDEIEAYAVAGMQDAIDQTLAESKAEIDDAVARANAAANAAAITGKVYDTPEAGVDPVTGVQNGAYYNVRSPDDDSFLVEYQNIGGVPTPSGKSYPSSAALNALKDALIDPESGLPSAAKIMDESGLNQQEVNNSVVQLIANIEALRSYKGGKNKQQVGTLEYHNGSGYGGALYQWDAGSTDNDDGMFTFAVTGVETGRWKLVIENNALNASKVGVKGGLISSSVASDYTDHIKMQALIDYFSSIGGGNIYVNGGKTYQWNVQHKSKVKIIGLGSDGLRPTIRCRDVSNTHLFTMAQPKCYLENFNLNGYDSREILQTGGSGNIGAFSGIAFQSTGLIAKNITATRCRMDGVYMNSGANDVHIYNLDSRFHARNTVSITNAWNVHFYNPVVEQRAAIQPFAYNFDIEPDTGSTQTVYDIHIHNPVMLGEGTLLLKEENTPNGRMDVHIYYPQMDIRIRLNSVVHGLYIYGGKFTNGLFSAETGRPGTAVDGFIDGAVISGSPFVQTTVTIGGDFVFRNNTINEMSEASPARTQGTWENNTFGPGVTPVANVDRRTLTLPYREKALLEVVSPTGALTAYNTTEVRQVNLTTTPTPILTAKNRSTSIITIAAADASAGGSIGLVELIISSDDTASTTFATDKINGVAGITYSWSGRTLSLAAKDAVANQWVVKVETFAAGSNYKQVSWLV